MQRRFPIADPGPFVEEGTVATGDQLIHAGFDVARTLDEGVVWTAHEMRAPLVAAKAALDHLVAIGSSGEANPELLRRTRDELELVLRFVDPLLRCAAGITGPLADVDLAVLALEVVEAEAQRSPEARGRLKLLASRSLMVKANPELLKIALSNIVRNAVLHSDVSDPILVSVTGKDSIAVVRVEDRGPGVLPGEHDVIFEWGRRGRLADRRGPGQGLGLFIVRRIVEAHGGSVRVERSEIGAVFRLELPQAVGDRQACAS